nr:MAG TPA: hypothetical protein [Caudoviricetes sp.]
MDLGLGRFFYLGSLRVKCTLRVVRLCKPPPPFALCYINFCTRCVLKVTSAFALYRIAEYKKSDGTVAFVFTSYK